MTTRYLRCSELRKLYVSILFLCIGQVGISWGGNIPTVYLETFQELHDGSKPEWKAMKDVDTWFEQERDRIEEVALEWLRAAHDTVEWRRGLFLSRKILSAPVCEMVFESVRNELAHAAANGVPVGEEDHMALAGPIVVLASCGDTRALPALHQLLGDALCPRRLIEEYLGALRRIGSATSINVIREIAARKSDTMLDRAAALTENMLMARGAGRDILEDSQRELRAITRAWIEAVETKDIGAYLSVLPYAARSGVDDHDFRVELLGAPALPEMLEAAKQAAQAEDDAFRIDRDRLEASIVVHGGYRFLYVLEVDGWKIAGPIGVGP